MPKRIMKYDGKGGFAPNSSKIPATAWVWAVVALAGATGVMYLGAIVGF